MQEGTLDEEWADLMMQARELGITIEEIREFFILCG